MGGKKPQTNQRGRERWDEHSSFLLAFNTSILSDEKPPKKTRNVCVREKKTLKDRCENSPEEIYSLSVQPSGVTAGERDSATAKGGLTRGYGVLLCWQAPVQPPGPSGQRLSGNRERGSYSGIF